MIQRVEENGEILFNIITDGIGDRPVNANYPGDMFFDHSLGKPIWWNGTSWVDATGATV